MRSLDDDRHVAAAQQPLPETPTTSPPKPQQPPHPNNHLLAQTTTSTISSPLLIQQATSITAPGPRDLPSAANPAVRGQSGRPQPRKDGNGVPSVRLKPLMDW